MHCACQESGRCRSGRFIRHAQPYSGCRLGGMHRRTAEGQVAEPQPTDGEQLPDATLALPRSAPRVLGAKRMGCAQSGAHAPQRLPSRPLHPRPAAKRLGSSSPQNGLSDLGQHDSCPPWATVARPDIWNRGAATAWSHIIHPHIGLGPLYRTHRLLQRDPTCSVWPADRVRCQSTRSIAQLHSIRRARTVQRRYCRRAPRQPAILPHTGRPCSSQTQNPSSKRNLATGLLALRVSYRFGPQATGCRLETDYSGVAHRSSRNLRRVPDSQTAARLPCRGAPSTRRERHPADHWLSPAAACPTSYVGSSQV
jgi:hypothetical protein